MAQGSEKQGDPQVREILGHGWKEMDSPPCAALESARFFEAEGEGGNAEFYFSREKKAYAAVENWPAGSLDCRPIPSPNFVQEVP